MLDLVAAFGRGWLTFDLSLAAQTDLFDWVQWDLRMCVTFSCCFLPLQLQEAETVQHIFSNNYQLCSEISESVLQHFIHCLATHGRHVQYLNFLHTIIKAEGKYVKKCQDMIMTEVRRRAAVALCPCFHGDLLTPSPCLS